MLRLNMFLIVIFFQTMFFAMLVIYSAFVLTSIYENFETVGEFLEIYVYAWAFGDFVEELISCFVCIFSKMLSRIFCKQF